MTSRKLGRNGGKSLSRRELCNRGGQGGQVGRTGQGSAGQGETEEVGG